MSAADLPEDPIAALAAIRVILRAIEGDSYGEGALDAARDCAVLISDLIETPQSLERDATRQALQRLAWRADEGADRIESALQRIAALARAADPELRAMDAAGAARVAAIEATGRPPYEPTFAEILAAEIALKAKGLDASRAEIVRWLQEARDE